MGYDVTSIRTGLLVVSDEWMDAHSEYAYANATAYYDADDPDELEELMISNYSISGSEIVNYNTLGRQNQSLVMIIAIFAYGFIIVIVLIGVTNIFNTITTSMDLRSREFAMLQSVGMTRKEFNRMIRLESIFYGIKSLVIGVVLGSVLSYLIYLSLASSIDMGYSLPVLGILISIAAVALLLFSIMRFSVKKILKRNVIEDIRRDYV